MSRPRPEGLDAPWVRRALIAVSQVAVWLYRSSGGKLGKIWLRGAPLCLVTTTGRRTGARRTAPLVFLEDADRVVVVACQGGLPGHPQWYLNLRAAPQCELQIGSRRRRVLARVAQEPERSALWPRLVRVYPDFADYEAWKGAALPVVILEPAT